MANNKTPAQSIDDLKAIATSNRVVHVFDVPETLQKTSRGLVITNIGVAELTPMDEQSAAQRARGDGHRLAFELALASLASVNGRAVSLANGSAEEAWTAMGPKLRNLVMTAFGELNGAGQEAAASFLKSGKLAS